MPARSQRCPFAEWVPWHYPSAEPGNEGRPTYYVGINQPIAVVLHIMEGFATTARQWANIGKYPKSWHFTVSRDGSIMQHLDAQHGGYHAGITDAQGQDHPPTWELWQGLGKNVNHYTIGIEHEGFYQGYPWPQAQLDASKRLCQWISAEWGIPYDRVHFPAHAEIDTVNRVNDFAMPAAREDHYRFLFEEDAMTPEERARLERVERLLAGNGINVAPAGAPPDILTGEAALARLDGLGVSISLGIDNLNGALSEHKANHPGGFTAEDIERMAVDAVADKLVE